MTDTNSTGTLWYRIGAVAALVLGLGYLAIIPLYATAGPPPHTGADWFAYLPGKTALWWGIIALSVATDLLYVPVAAALFLALERISRGAMALAVAFIGLFVVLDLAVTWTHIGSILELYERYAAAGDAAVRDNLIAAADYAAVILSSPLEAVYAIATLAIGVLVAGLVMLRGVFNKATAVTAILAGVLGLAAPGGLAPVIYGNALAVTAWLFLVSFKLFRLK
jgi:hypothetical protein